MVTSGGWRRSALRFRQRTAGSPAFVRVSLAALLVLLLTGCPGIPPPEALDFEKDPRILRGTWAGWLDLREGPNRVALAGDAPIVATAWQHTVEVTDLSTSAVLTTFEFGAGSDSWLTDLSIDALGSRVAGIVDGKVQVWSVLDGSTLSSFDLHDSFGTCLDCGAEVATLDPAGARLAVAGSAPRIVVLDVDAGTVIATLDTAAGEVPYVGFSADGTRLAAGSFSRVQDSTSYTLRVWSVPSFEPLFEAEGRFPHWDRVNFAFSADGTRFAAGTVLATQLHDVASRSGTPPRPGPADVSLAALSPDGTQGAFVRWLDVDLIHVEVVDLNTGAVLATLEPTGNFSAAWFADGALLRVGWVVYSAADYDAGPELTKGALHELELVSTAEYVDPETYRFAGALTVDGAVPIDVAGTVSGYESQRYLRPQARMPFPATLRLDVAELGWSLHGYQNHYQYLSNGLQMPSWRGFMSYLDEPEEPIFLRFLLERADL